MWFWTFSAPDRPTTKITWFFFLTLLRTSLVFRRFRLRLKQQWPLYRQKTLRDLLWIPSSQIFTQLAGVSPSSARAACDCFSAPSKESYSPQMTAEDIKISPLQYHASWSCSQRAKMWYGKKFRKSPAGDFCLITFFAQLSRIWLTSRFFIVSRRKFSPWVGSARGHLGRFDSFHIASGQGTNSSITL